MFIFTAKVNRRKLTAAAVAGVVLCGALVALFVLLGGKGTAVSALADPKGVRTNEDRIAYLEQFGWTVDPEPAAVEELLIPETFDETYTQYLALQSSQGFDLTKYCDGLIVGRYRIGVALTDDRGDERLIFCTFEVR